MENQTIYVQGFNNFNGVLSLLVYDKTDGILSEIDLLNIRLSYPRVAGEISNFRAENVGESDTEQEVAESLVEAIRQRRLLLSSSDLADKDQRLKYLDKLYDIVRISFADRNLPSIIKLKFNSQHNVIYDLLRQLKPAVIDSPDPFISATWRQIAEFLIAHVENFADSKIDSLIAELQAKKNTPMGRKFEVKTKG